MDNSEDIELHELETIEQNLNVEAASEHDAPGASGTDGFMPQSASGFMVI
jgi:hypothetical protein